MFTPPQLSDVQDEECIEEQSSNAIYERQMLPKKRGFPLWIPQPNSLAFPMHQRKGVIIGDLGRITSYGAFDVQFNICEAAGHPNNPYLLPHGFKPLALDANDIHRFQEYTSGSYIASTSVKKLRLGSEILGSFTYWLTNWLVGLLFGVPALREPFLLCQTGPCARI